MAITRAQIARQLLQFGGGADASKDDFGGGPGPGDGGGSNFGQFQRAIQRTKNNPVAEGAGGGSKTLATLGLLSNFINPASLIMSQMPFKAQQALTGINALSKINDIKKMQSSFDDDDNEDENLTETLGENIRNLPNFTGKVKKTKTRAEELLEEINNMAEGGSINDQIRQAYGIGSIVKKAVGAVKKVAKSPVGKVALIGGGLGLAGIGPLSGLANTKFGTALGGFFGKGSFNPLKAITAVTGKRGPMPMTNLSGLGKLISRIPGGGVTAAITATSLLPLLGIGTGEETEEEAQAILQDQGIDIDAIKADPNKYLSRAFKAEGGSMDEPVAKKTMPLLDMGGQEMDLRAEGGFVPIGRMEKADDVPARLSKNEFVFTAEAVRNAGEGDVDKGAEVMYNMMKNLEAGGDVSEESQGLEGARRMFQTSQRLEEVL